MSEHYFADRQKKSFVLPRHIHLQSSINSLSASIVASIKILNIQIFVLDAHAKINCSVFHTLVVMEKNPLLPSERRLCCCCCCCCRACHNSCCCCCFMSVLEFDAPVAADVIGIAIVVGEERRGSETIIIIVDECDLVSS